MDVMTSLFNVCDPLKPSPEKAYVDLCIARGNESIISLLERRIRREDRAHLLFSGHPGGGKSTELLRLCERLRNPQGNTARFFPVYMDAEEYVNRFDVEITETLLGIVGSVAESLREKEDIHLESSYLQSRWEEIKSFAMSQVELEKMKFLLSDIAKFTVKLKQAGEDSRRKVREKLIPQLPSLLGEINLVLERARIELKKKDYQDLVLVVDNLEKIPDNVDPETKRGTYYRIFIAGAEQLRALETHIVLTIPLPLIRSPQRMQVVQAFGEEPVVLPMVKVEEKNGDPCENGLELMKDVLRCRFKLAGVEEKDIFDSPERFTYLCKMSGGHVRNLLIYFRSSSDYVDSLPINNDAIRRGVRRHINAYSGAIPEKNWDHLARLHLDPDKHIPNDDDHQAMLGDLSILEYMNDGEPWYAVSPVVRELEKFKRAVEAARAQQVTK